MFDLAISQSRFHPQLGLQYMQIKIVARWMHCHRFRCVKSTFGFRRRWRRHGRTKKLCVARGIAPSLQSQSTLFGPDLSVVVVPVARVCAFVRVSTWIPLIGKKKQSYNFDTIMSLQRQTTPNVKYGFFYPFNCRRMFCVKAEVFLNRFLSVKHVL